METSNGFLQGIAPERFRGSRGEGVGSREPTPGWRGIEIWTHYALLQAISAQ
ncbi:hypothetical protein [Nostoc sp. KVJ20]|uniref:hypothetical protein n=1 Tax=Nostoc sp. KVJ20 TaxID=457944 RepID=UPI00159F0C6D|nr:hypothetical protein [Nostoc sp. KVJ20]